MSIIYEKVTLCLFFFLSDLHRFPRGSNLQIFPVPWGHPPPTPCSGHFSEAVQLAALSVPGPWGPGISTLESREREFN